MNAERREKDGLTRQENAARVVDLSDPARDDDPGEFQGHHLGAGVSFIVVDAPPGSGPRLHRHPYEEVFRYPETFRRRRFYPDAVHRDR